MSFLLVGDNRSNNNWGGRAGSLALFAHLRKILGDGRSVLGTELSLAAAGYGFRTRLLPGAVAWRVRNWSLHPDGNPLLRALCALDRRLGGGDFLSDDPAESVRNLLARRRSDPGLADLYDRVAGAEVVVINGEGDVVLGTPVRRQIRFFAALVRLAGQLGKRIAFVNTMLSDDARTGRDPVAFALMAEALRGCDVVAVRDPVSLRIAREDMGLADACQIPDALFLWYESQREARRQLPTNGDFLLPQPEREEFLGRLDLSGAYICVGGNSLATQPGRLAGLVSAYRRLCLGLGELGYPVYLAVTDGRDRFLEQVARDLDLGVIPVGTPIHLAAAILGRARLLVSGRYHPSIMAALGGTPCLYLEAGAHKMASLVEVLADEPDTVFAAEPTEADVRQIRERAIARLSAGEELRRRIAGVAAALADEAAGLGALILGGGEPIGNRTENPHA